MQIIHYLMHNKIIIINSEKSVDTEGDDKMFITILNATKNYDNCSRKHDTEKRRRRRRKGTEKVCLQGIKIQLSL